MTLLVLCGLPGVGKSAIGRECAHWLEATYLRIDSIESAIVSTLLPFEGNPVGYVVAERVAADQLRSGRGVVVDACNNLEIARDGWRRLAADHGIDARFVEVVCSDPAAHRQRVEGRVAEMPGHGVPTWQQVTERVWEPFADASERLLVDNIGTVAAAVQRVLVWVETT